MRLAPSALVGLLLSLPASADETLDALRAQVAQLQSRLDALAPLVAAQSAVRVQRLVLHDALLGNPTVKASSGSFTLHRPALVVFRGEARETLAHVAAPLNFTVTEASIGASFCPASPSHTTPGAQPLFSCALALDPGLHEWRVYNPNFLRSTRLMVEILVLSGGP